MCTSRNLRIYGGRWCNMTVTPFDDGDCNHAIDIIVCERRRHFDLLRSSTIGDILLLELTTTIGGRRC